MRTPDKHIDHIRWLVDLAGGEDPPISKDVALVAFLSWSQVLLETECQMPAPAAAAGPDGRMFYSWDRGRYHLELEIIPGQPSEWFYRDRETDESWGEDWITCRPLPWKVVTVLAFFFERAS